MPVPPPDSPPEDPANAATQSPSDIAVTQASDPGSTPTQACDPGSAATVSGPGPSAARPDTAPEIPGYEILEELGRGGMGVVYRARQTGADRTVALKLMGMGMGEAMKVRFRREVEAFASLDHPHIVPVHDVGEVGGLPFFTMKLVEGGDLSTRLPEFREDPLRTARLVARICAGIGHAHQRGFLHRDLKPANILLDEEGLPLITDFGLAKRLDEEGELTRTGQIMGTPGYMAPEQARGLVRDQTTLTDVYAIGAILYQILTGRPPFSGENTMEVLRMVQEEPPVPPRTLARKSDPSLEVIALRCLAKDPADRYPSAAALKSDLESYLRGESIDPGADAASRFMKALFRDSRHTEVLARWGRVWMSHAILTAVAFVTLNVLRLRGAGPLSYVAVLLPYFVLMNLGVWWYRIRAGIPMSSIERQIGLIWGGFGIHSTLVLVLGMKLGLPLSGLLAFAVLGGFMAFLAMSAILGGTFYVLTIDCALLPLFIVVFPSIGLGLFGILFAVGLFIPGYRFSRALV